MLLSGRGASSVADGLGRAAGGEVGLAGLGPGPGPWRHAEPERFGLDGAALRRAAEAAMIAAPDRYCILVVKNGMIVYESYDKGGGEDAAYEADSLAKTATALVVGAAIRAGFFDLDTPLAAYGLAPKCPGGSYCWRVVNCTLDKECPSGPLGYYPNVTARVLLAQSSGCVTGTGCTAAPGTAFTYDSEVYIQHLVKLIAQTCGTTPREFASAFMDKLGLVGYYDNDEMGGGFSAGGGQMVTCRQVARLGQLIVNKGLWPTRGGMVERLLTEEYVRELLTPQYPERGFSYGLLTWLSVPRPLGAVACCAPRWGPDSTCSGSRLEGPLLGDDIVEGPSELVAMAMGWIGKYLYVVPSRNLTIVSMGSTWGASLQCRVGATRPTDPSYNDGYDDAFSSTVVWRALDKALRPASALATAAAADGEVAPIADRRSGRAGRAEAEPPTALATVAGKEAATTGGSCSCLCPPGNGWGYCYDMPRGVTDCHEMLYKAADDCPALGVARQCHDPPEPEDTNCSAADGSIRGDIGNTRVWGGHMTCSLERECASMVEGVVSMTCRCMPKLYGIYGCSYDKHPCSHKGMLTPYSRLGSPLAGPAA